MVTIHAVKAAALVLFASGLLAGQAINHDLGGKERLTLTLRDAVQRAIENSPEVAAEKIYTQRADALLRAARGVFDPVVRMGGELRRESRPSSSVLEAPNGRLDEHFANGSVSFLQRIPLTGMLLTGAFENVRQSSTNPLYTLNPFYSPRVRFALNIPLLRGFRNDPQRTEIVVKRRESRLARWELRSRLTEKASRTITAYWHLVAARESLEVAQRTRNAAREALASTERLAREGDQATAEVFGAKGQLQRAEEALAEAAGAELQAQSALKALIAASEADPILGVTLDLTDQDAIPPNAGLAEQLQLAMQSRPDLSAAAERIRIQESLHSQAANETLPKVDLQFSYLGQGLSGRPQEVSSAAIPGLDLRPPAGLIGSTWTGLEQIRSNQFPTYSASLSIEIPIRNRSAEGRLLDAMLARKQQHLLRDQLRIQIALEVRQALDAIAAAQARRQAAEQAELSSEERLASEFRLYREGQSNNLNLNVRQNELAQSRQLTVRARLFYNSASTELLRVTGQTLSAFGVRLEEPSRQ